jgi:hypothetical protein
MKASDVEALLEAVFGSGHISFNERDMTRGSHRQDQVNVTGLAVDILMQKIQDSAALSSRLTTLESTAVESEARFRRLEQIVHALQLQLEQVPVADKPSQEAAAEPWEETHADELQAHAGEYVAVHQELGIVAHGASLKEVNQQVREKQLPKLSVAYQFVRQER